MTYSITFTVVVEADNESFAVQEARNLLSDPAFEPLWVEVLEE